MGTKLFVGGLAWATSSDSLRAAFEPHGTVEDAVVITDRETGRSRGFGFVTMADDAAAAAAIDIMNGASLDGRNVRVNKAEERSSRGPGRPGPRGRPRRDFDRGRPSGSGSPSRRGGPGSTGRYSGGPRGGGSRGASRGGGGGWGGPPQEDAGESWADDGGKRRSKRSRKFDSGGGDGKRGSQSGQDGRYDRGDRGGGGRGRRRSWDDWDDD